MSDPTRSDKPPTRDKPCPICGRPPVTEFRPFCSKRCRSVDLNRWLGGSYAIPGEPAPGDDPDQG